VPTYYAVVRPNLDLSEKLAHQLFLIDKHLHQVYFFRWLLIFSSEICRGQTDGRKKRQDPQCGLLGRPRKKRKVFLEP